MRFAAVVDAALWRRRPARRIRYRPRRRAPQAVSQAAELVLAGEPNDDRTDITWAPAEVALLPTAVRQVAGEQLAVVLIFFGAVT